MRPWWQDAVLYQVYPRSYRDSNGDGVGDLPGVIEKLDHLAWLGVDGIWLNPIMPSPNEDWGYDVSDYTAVHDELGTLEDVDRLVAESAARGIKVLFDLVPNHTSDRHLWFQDALTGRGAAHRDWYVWADPAPEGGPPNNWISVFDLQPAWKLHEPTGQYYLHNFLSTQPDLNWWNEELKDAFDDIFRFWYERGIAGFRIDVAHGIVKDRALRDNLPVEDTDHPEVKRLGQKKTYNFNRPEVHEILRRWRKLGDAFDAPRVLVGETYVLSVEELSGFYGSGSDELHLAFNFPFVFAGFEAKALREIVETTLQTIPPDAWPVWMGSNHDVGRFPTRWCDGSDDKKRVALMLLLTLRGSVFLYYGDEIGMDAVSVPRAATKDPVARFLWPESKGRDGFRTPMQWDASPGAGFTAPEVQPWLPMGNHRACNVAAQRADPASILNLCRDLMSLRRSSADLTAAEYEGLQSEDGGWIYRRGRKVVMLNLSDRAIAAPTETARVDISSRRDRDGEAASGTIRLRPWEGLVLSVSAGARGSSRSGR